MMARLAVNIRAGVAAALLAGWPCAQAWAAPPAVCAIRWDAWYSNDPHDPAAATAAALSKPQWRDRTPLNAQIDATGRVTFRATQALFDAEIRSAKQADLCWAYLTYGQGGVIDLNNAMMRGLALHRSSAIKDLVPYALMVQAPTLGGPGRAREAAAQVLTLMHDSNYRKVSINGVQRPLLLFYYDQTDVGKTFNGSPAALREPFDLIAQGSRAQGLGNPYVVVLAGAAQAEAVRRAIGADAISSYTVGRRNGHVMPWADYEATFAPQWNSYAAATPAGVVPTLSTGGDIRARCETPPPWDRGRFPAGVPCTNYAVNPTPSQLAGEFREAAGWLRAHPGKDPANLLLVYAWSECDEGGNCLMPTYGDPTGAKVRVIRDALAVGPMRP